MRKVARLGDKSSPSSSSTINSSSAALKGSGVSASPGLSRVLRSPHGHSSSEMADSNWRCEPVALKQLELTVSRAERGEDNVVALSHSRSRSMSASEMGWKNSGGALVCRIAFAKALLSDCPTRRNMHVCVFSFWIVSPLFASLRVSIINVYLPVRLRQWWGLIGNQIFPLHVLFLHSGLYLKVCCPAGNP